MKKTCTAFLFFILILFSACGGASKNSGQRNTASTQPKGTNPVIGFSIDTLAIERWQRDLDVFMGSARELGADVIVQNAGNSVEEQNRQLLYLASRNVDVIVVVAKDGAAIGDTLEKIRARNIPVISYDRLVINAPISLYITIDSEKVGMLMGKKMREVTESKKWKCVLGPREDYNMTMILGGLKKSLEGTDVVIDEVFYTDGWNYDISHQMMVEMITGGTVPEAVICGNDAVADSVISAFSMYYPNHHVPICGQDADIAACQNIVRGLQDFSVYKPITDLASLSARYAYLLATRQKIAAIDESAALGTIDNGYAEIPCVMLSPVIVDRNNIDSLIIDSGFHTYGEVYRNIEPVQ